MITEIWWVDSLPMHWIVLDDGGQWWLVPARDGGWRNRTVYLGHQRGLNRAMESTEALTKALMMKGIEQ